MAEVENEDKSFAVGINPTYAWCDATSEWRKLRCDNQGRMLTSQSSETGVFTIPSNGSEITIVNNAVDLVSITNIGVGVVEVLDGSTVIGYALAAAQTLIPANISTSLKVRQITGALSSVKISVVWRT